MIQDSINNHVRSPWNNGTNDRYFQHDSGQEQIDRIQKKIAKLFPLDFPLESVDEGCVFGALLTDLSKYFNCLQRNLLISKLNAYGFDNDYLRSHKQRTKISDTYSLLQETLSEVSQGSLLEPLLFNIDICDLFFITENVIWKTMQMTLHHI